MNYKLKFIPSALKEFKKLDNSVKNVFKNKLKERLENPHVPSAKLRGFKNVYKIKIKSPGYRLVYEVFDKEIYILVLTVGKRENNEIYQKLIKRIRIKHKE